MLVSYNGTAGHEITKLRVFNYPFKRGSILVMHTDGLSSKWDLSKYAGIYEKHPSIIAGVLYIDNNKERDDTAVLVIK